MQPTGIGGSEMQKGRENEHRPSAPTKQVIKFPGYGRHIPTVIDFPDSLIPFHSNITSLTAPPPGKQVAD